MPDEPAPPPARAELDDAPPFLSWNAIYLIVVGALIVEIVAGVIVTAGFR
jgi:hypothetical protein